MLSSLVSCIICGLLIKQFIYLSFLQTLQIITPTQFKNLDFTSFNALGGYPTTVQKKTHNQLVGRLPSEELMAQIPSFLPALFDAFGNHSADVRKMVVSFPVDIYIVLGKALLPYLGSLSSTQLRLVTIHANRISQARSGVVVDMQNVEAMTGHINCLTKYLKKMCPRGLQ
ncbi:uncharacterized protein LOC131874603 isoform X1 [Cryptomeria japonica]|uniref:uncharacterized protein LOC131874603 isoform X1 n=1 Tax=Cryptomeria japonica TaxID=3369 RepID=UPI0027DA695E|nr:uncharacterized protein LOC131874603 isoform X1 [Cryptomeria japonica]